MAEKKVIELEIKTNSKKVEKDLKDVGVASNKTSKSVDDLGNSAIKSNEKFGAFGNMKSSITSLVPGLGAVGKGVDGLGAKFMRLLANPIVLLIAGIVAGLTLLFKAFTSTKDGGDQLAQVMSGLSAVVDVVRDRILNVGNAIVKFFSGDFKGALAEGKKAVSGFGAEVTKEFKAAANATKQLQQVEDAFNRLSVSRAKVNRDLAISKELLTDENASFEDKRKALEKIKKTEGEQTRQELANAKKKYEAIKAQNALSDTSREDKKKEQDAMIALIALEERSATDRRAINKQEKTLNNQANASRKEAYEAEKTRRAEASRAEKTRRAEALKAEQDLLKQKQDIINKIKKADLDYTDTLLTEQEKEKVIVARKYEELYAEAIKFKLDTTKLKENETAELAKIEKKYLEAQKIANDKAEEEKQKTEKETNEKIALLKKEEQFRLNELTKSEAELKLIKLDEEYKSEQLLYKDNKEILKALDIKYDKDKQDLENAELARKRENTKKGIDMAMSALSVLNDAIQMGAGKSEKDQRRAFKAQKAFNLASAVVNTYLAVTGALTAGGNPLKLATGAQFVEAGIAGAMGALQIAKIAKTQFEGGASADTSGGGGGGGGGVTAPTMSAPQFNVVGQSGVNQLASLGQQPIQAYVVSGQVTSQQALDRNRLANATLGG
jgi:hypothetical protein